uniref:Ribosomal protein L16 n=1 Tax=Dictyopteris divaricata TaxID=156996 RepID=A0A4Y5T7U0_9PHAE|nr:ribosomal protein L16 [Dictyopteris divaricata]QDB64125.1 ribosomal protein L16 [Dictyopteris divaricata]
MQPLKTKYRKYYKPRQVPKINPKLLTLKPHSHLSLISLESTYVNGRQIEAARQTIRRKIKRRGRLKIMIFPDIGISKKSTSSRMGKGKGKIDHWVGKISAGKTIFQLIGVPVKDGIPALKSGSNKFPIKVKICQN